jgi:hypothetical protein
LTVNEQTEWTADIVKNEMVLAFEVLFDTTGRVGPRGHTSNWPEYLQQVTTSDNAEQQLAGTNSVGRMRARVQRSAREISNMEKVLLGHRNKDGRNLPAWPIGFLQDSDGMRRCLVSWCIWEVRGWHAKKECKRRGWSYTTFRRLRDRAAEIIAFRLNEEGVDLW